MEAFLSSTFGVFIAEIGDKTQLLTLFLAARFAQKNAVIAGIFAATLLNHLVSAWLGVWLAASVSPVLVKWIVGLSFIAVGLWLLKPDKDDDSDNGRWLKYGAFAAIPVFLIWLNLLWMLLLTGAVLTASLSYWQDDAFRRSFGAHGRFDDVLKILLMLYRAQNDGQTLCVQDFRSRINMGYDELGDLLEKLARHGYVYQGQNGWVLKTNAEHIGLDELFKLFVYRPARTTQDAVGEAVSRILTPGLESMNMSLAEFERQTRKEGGGMGRPSEKYNRLTD